ncbi:MAG: hypothetical protein OJF49_004668 [Ktedonobacterales bacterium]|jgi:hypothetical protein|nr:MAG: hypothetical protein OJF49_004668 [Ktedonobacterales bacterium]
MRELQADDVVCAALPEVGAADVVGTAEYVAWVQIQDVHRALGADTAQWDQTWQRLCWQVTARMEIVEGREDGKAELKGSDTHGAHRAGALAGSPLRNDSEGLRFTGALLALGWCAATEAAGVAHGLVGRLAAAGYRARMGIGPNATLAQLALQCGRAASKLKGQTVVVVTPGEAVERLLARTPVGALAGLHPRGVVTAETVERLRRYGLRTLGQVARLVERSGEVALRRQFGPVVGGALVALARGEELRPLQPTMQPETLRCRVRWVMGGSATQVGVGLGRLAERIAGTLAEREQAAGRLRLRVVWAHGGVTEAETRLRERISEARRVAEGLRALWEQFVDQDTDHGAEHRENGQGRQGWERRAEVADVAVEIEDLVVVRPAQGAFWKGSVQQNATLSVLRARVRERFGTGSQGLGQITCVAPEAVFAEERYVVDEGSDEQMGGHPTRPTRLAGERAAVRTADGSAERVCGNPWADVPLRLHWW